MRFLPFNPLLQATMLIVSLLAAPAADAALVFEATLLGSNEVPPTASPATGSATLTVTGDALAVAVSFADLTGGAASAAHIHCCTLPGTNVGVAVALLGFPAATSGTYIHTFDLTDLATYSAAFLAASGGTASGAEAALLAGFEGGEAYVNIHDAVFPGGEIRGFVAPVAVPEPATLALLGLGLAAIALASRRPIR